MGSGSWWDGVGSECGGLGGEIIIQQEQLLALGTPDLGGVAAAVRLEGKQMTSSRDI